MKKIRTGILNKPLSFCLSVLVLLQCMYPATALALTSGPSQPEVQSFSPVGTSDMVDVFTGDFNYNIPLLDVGGYPINIAYSSGISTDQEASWTGLGWNLNPGAITRSMRGLPDEFNGDVVKSEFYQKDNLTIGVDATFDVETFGFEISDRAGLSFGAGIKFNTYKGFGLDVSAKPTFKLVDGAKNDLTVGMGLGLSSDDGLTVTPSASLEKSTKEGANNEAGPITTSTLALPFNTRTGLKAVTFQHSKQLSGTGKNVFGTSYSFASPSYTPTQSFPMSNFSASFSVKGGATIFGLQGAAEGTGYMSTQYVSPEKKDRQAYGYMFSQNAKATSMMDVNREKDGAVTKSTPNIALAQHTYDVYSVSGQGIGGSFRSARSDAGGALHDPYLNNSGGGVDLGGFDISGGNIVQGGLNFQIANTYTKTGGWGDGYNVTGLDFKSEKSAGLTDDYEVSYFKQAGDLHGESDKGVFNSLGGFYPVRVDLNKSNNPATIENRFDRGIALGTISRTFRNQREMKSQTITKYNPEDATALFGEIKFYEGVGESEVLKTYTRASHSGNKKDHISLIQAIRKDGMRYRYGIPAYNRKQYDASFAVEGSVIDGKVSYSPSDLVNKGSLPKNKFFQSTELPGFAHSYLLTEILSPDYIDKTGDGVTPDDLGTYTKINYRRTDKGYKWRAPYEQGKANYNEGLKTDFNDDKGNLSYGVKELYYVHSIETRTHIAVFDISDRRDGHGVKDVNGGRSLDDKMKKLSSIRLYARPEYEKGGDPIKTVHFVYDYSLCKGNDVTNLENNDGQASSDIDELDNQGGKLTLKQIYFTYEGSKKGKLSPYVFNYDDDKNYNYHHKAYDRWGNFKEELGDERNDNKEASNTQFPYVIQGDISNDYAAAWTMSSIELPSGGVINVEYEADDYAFVQDKRAAQMFKIKGFDTDDTFAGADQNTYGLAPSSKSYIHFEFDEPVSSDEEARSKYLIDHKGEAMKYLYFKVLSKVASGISELNEFVPGYAKIEKVGVSSDTKNAEGKYTHGYVKVEDTKISSTNPLRFNPIALSVIQFARMYRSEIALNPGSALNPDQSADLMSLVTAFTSLGSNVMSALTGPNNFLVLPEISCGKEVKLDKSFIRLYNPNYAKKGGGLRVKKLTMSDKWEAMARGAEYTAEYGQTYSYVLEDGKSSGVAAYEPMIGGDENIHKQPVFAKDKKFLGPDNEYYQEGPFGESFFPGPSVGYSKVEVANISYANVTANATGKVVHEFFTAKDFPSYTSKTDLDMQNKGPNILASLFGFSGQSMRCSQGFLVELNNMHGQQKKQSVYREGDDTPISSVEYKYKTQFDSRRGTILDNGIITVDENGSVSKNQVGVEWDLFTDTRYSEVVSENTGVSANLNGFLAVLAPVTVPAAYPVYNKSKMTFGSVSLTKVINRYGILEKTIARDLGSQVDTKNLAWDDETGDVLLTETVNQFDDPIFSFTYPAHWGYDGMGLAAKNIDYKVESSQDNLTNTSLNASLLVPGDELLLKGSSGTISRGWVTSTNPVVIKDRYKVEITTPFSEARIIRSGRRNMASSPIGSVVSLQNPLVNEGNETYSLVLSESSIDNGYDEQVLNAEAMIYGTEWRSYCNCDYSDYERYNDFVNGKQGVYRPKKSYLYLTDRTQNSENTNTYVREDGRYGDFVPFWQFNTTNWSPVEGDWTWTSEVTEFSPRGQELENQDALGRFSSALYGFSELLPTAVANNALHKEVGFDSFEDYEYDQCIDDHFSFRQYVIEDKKLADDGNLLTGKDTHIISEKRSHSGRHSIYIAPKNKVELERVLDPCQNTNSNNSNDNSNSSHDG